MRQRNFKILVTLDALVYLFSIDAQYLEFGVVEVYTMEGNRILQMILEGNCSTYQLDLSGFLPDMYLLAIKSITKGIVVKNIKY